MDSDRDYEKIQNVVWSNVWESDPYSEIGLRRIKASEKVSIIKDMINPQPGWNVVDLGCGPGYVSEELYKQFKCQITGVDISKKAIDMASSRLSNLPIRFINADACFTGIESSSSDLVICCGSLEHVPDADGFIKEVRRILKPNGYLFIITSNMYSFVWINRLVRQLLGIWQYGYQKNWSPSGIKNLLSSHSISIVDEERLIYLGDLKKLGKLDTLIAKLSKYWGRYFIVIGRKS